MYNYKTNNKKVISGLIIGLIILAVIIGIIYYSITNIKNDKDEINIEPIHMKKYSSIELDTLWVGSFQLAWNELKSMIRWRCLI